MSEEKAEQYIVPPRLSRKQIFFGYTVWEAFTMLALFILTLFTRSTIFIPPCAFVAVLCFRPPERDANALALIRILFNYYRVSPIYSLRECDHS